MKRLKQLFTMAALGLVLSGCGGGGGGSGDAGVPPPSGNAFTAAVQSAVATSSEDAEPAELTLDSGGDAGADDEPVTL